VDLSAGPNVDVVLRDPYDWRELSAASADVVIFGQTFEHTEFFGNNAANRASPKNARRSHAKRPNHTQYF
jgi:hypothetical protein